MYAVPGSKDSGCLLALNCRIGADNDDGAT